MFLISFKLANLIFINIFANSNDLVFGVISKIDVQLIPWKPVALIFIFLWFLTTIFFVPGS
jgi:hypothetical protein